MCPTERNAFQVVKGHVETGCGDGAHLYVTLHKECPKVGTQVAQRLTERLGTFLSLRD